LTAIDQEDGHGRIAPMSEQCQLLHEFQQPDIQQQSVNELSGYWRNCRNSFCTKPSTLLVIFPKKNKTERQDTFGVKETV